MSTPCHLESPYKAWFQMLDTQKHAQEKVSSCWKSDIHILMLLANWKSMYQATEVCTHVSPPDYSTRETLSAPVMFLLPSLSLSPLVHRDAHSALPGGHRTK